LTTSFSIIFHVPDSGKHNSKCAGIISNAGFELASEALQLGKKILASVPRVPWQNALAALGFKVGNLGPGQGLIAANSN
jgi:hypothetical protein